MVCIRSLYNISSMDKMDISIYSINDDIGGILIWILKHLDIKIIHLQYGKN